MLPVQKEHQATKFNDSNSIFKNHTKRFRGAFMHLENKNKIIRRHTVSGVYMRTTTLFQCLHKYKFLGSVDTDFYKRDTQFKSCWLQKPGC